MNLPVLTELNNNQSTYITFTKSLFDFDKAITNNEVCFFSKAIALKLPNWSNSEPNSIFIDLVSELPEIDLPATTNPNIIFPKMIQYYMENIIRQDISIDNNDVEEIAELAFWKMLNKMGLDSQHTKETLTFFNSVMLSNFVKTENNNGWAEIIVQIPNKCKKLTPVWKNISNIKSVVETEDTDVALYDNGNKQFLFSSDFMKVIDFDNSLFEEVNGEFDFNVILLYYKDASGVDKLHGINFIYPFENKLTYWDLTKFTQKTNTQNTIGYQFKFNQKTCNNEATQLFVYEYQEHLFYNNFSTIISGLNSFLEDKMNQ